MNGTLFLPQPGAQLCPEISPCHRILTRSGRVEALMCGVLCLRKRGQRVVTFLVFFFHQEFFELKRRDMAKRRVKALGNVEGFNVSRRKTKEASTAQQRPASDSSVTKERHPESAAAEETKPKVPVTYRVSEQPSSRVQEEEFARQLRLARYLAAGGSPPSQRSESTLAAKSPKHGRPVAKAGTKATGKKSSQEELAKERWGAGRSVRRYRPLVRGEKQRQGQASGRAMN
jgi:hypothetical protein